MRRPGMILAITGPSRTRRTPSIPTSQQQAGKRAVPFRTCLANAYRKPVCESLSWCHHQRLLSSLVLAPVPAKSTPVLRTALADPRLKSIYSKPNGTSWADLVDKLRSRPSTHPSRTNINMSSRTPTSTPLKRSITPSTALPRSNLYRP